MGILKTPEAQQVLAEAKAINKAIVDASKGEEKKVTSTLLPHLSRKERDFDKEARGKTRCACINAAIQSPAAIAYAATEKEYIEFVKRLADMAVAYTFQE